MLIVFAKCFQHIRNQLGNKVMIIKTENYLKSKHRLSEKPVTQNYVIEVKKWHLGEGKILVINWYNYYLVEDSSFRKKPSHQLNNG